jgi:hypothetical protein
MFIVILSNFGNTSRFFSAQNVVQYILEIENIYVYFFSLNFIVSQ